MNCNKLLIDTLAATELPVVQDEYTGKAEKYIVFIYTDEIPVCGRSGQRKRHHAQRPQSLPPPSGICASRERHPLRQGGDHRRAGRRARR